MTEEAEFKRQDAEKVREEAEKHRVYAETVRRHRSDDDDDHSWLEYKELVIRELERLNRSLESLNDKIDKLINDEIAEMKIKIAMLEVRSGIWGAVAGAVTGLGLIILTKWPLHF